jgi:hypothetical protein
MSAIDVFFDTPHFPVYNRDTDVRSLTVVITGSMLSQDYKAKV